MSQTNSNTNAGAATTAQHEILWDCTSGAYETAEQTQEVVPHNIAIRNLPTTADGEHFYGEMMQDVKRMSMIENGEDAGISEQVAANPWLTKETITSGLKRSIQTLRDAGFGV